MEGAVDIGVRCHICIKLSDINEHTSIITDIFVMVPKTNRGTQSADTGILKNVIISPC